MHLNNQRPRLRAQRWWILAIVLALLVTPALPAAADGPAPDRQTAKYEIRFMQGMIDHHAMAVMMAEMCLEKAVHVDLRSLCEQIIAAQSQEIAMMQSWLQDWYGIQYEPQMPPGHEQHMQQVMMMSAQEFEVWFMRNMIGHHEAAIREAQHCLPRAGHAELLSLCQNIIATQSAEIEQMQAWLCEWYEICEEA